MKDTVEQMFAQRLKESRTSKGWTLARLVEALEEESLDTSVIARYEAAKNYPRPDRLRRMAAALGVSAAWLSGFEETPVISPTAVSLAISEATAARDSLTRLIRDLKKMAG